MIVKQHLFPWPEDHHSDYYNLYADILNNIERSCELQYANHSVLIIDNDGLTEPELRKFVMDNNCEINVVINLVDPPRPWHLVRDNVARVFPDKQFITIGNDHADIFIPFWLLLFFQQFPQYDLDQLQPMSFDHLFLAYNGKPQPHRVHLLDQLRERKLLDLGHWTLNQSGFHATTSQVQTLGDMTIWNSHFLNITTETCMLPWREALAIGEKVFKPIVGLRPFIINGSPKYYHEFQQLGFDCFADIWPIDQIIQQPKSRAYDIEVERIQVMQRTHNVICDIVQSLAGQDLSALYQTLYPRLLANRERFYTLGAEFVQRFCTDIIPLPTPTTV